MSPPAWNRFRIPTGRMKSAPLSMSTAVPIWLLPAAPSCPPTDLGAGSRTKYFPSSVALGTAGWRKLHYKSRISAIGKKSSTHSTMSRSLASARSSKAESAAGNHSGIFCLNNMASSASLPNALLAFGHSMCNWLREPSCLAGHSPRSPRVRGKPSSLRYRAACTGFLAKGFMSPPLTTTWPSATKNGSIRFSNCWASV